jgi:hypothetical protein
MLCVVLSASLNAYVMRDYVAGSAFWNGKEAYFFINRTHFGYHVKWIGYPLWGIGRWLGYIEPPDDVRATQYVIRVVSSHVERHVLELTDGIGADMLTPIEGRIWANCPKIGGLCWWAGDHFEPASQEERHRLDGISHLGADLNADESGWSRGMVMPGRSVAISLDDNSEISAYGEESIGLFSIEMRKQGSEPSSIFSLATRSGLVSRGEYKHAFQVTGGSVVR